MAEPARLVRQSSLRIQVPPSTHELHEYEDVPLHELPKPFKRADEDRVYCNRSLSLADIKFYGFDMDYTLALYKAPQIHEMVYEHAVERLVDQGYPAALRACKYSHPLAMRGLFFDRVYGNLLRVDRFGNIVRGTHGLHALTAEALQSFYPSKFIGPADMASNFFMLDTVFHIPESCLLANLVELFDHIENGTILPDRKGVKIGNHVILYVSIQADVREAIDFVHRTGLFKKSVTGDLEKFIEYDERLPHLFLRMREAGCKVFLATNSDYTYTNIVMTYLLERSPALHKAGSWRDFFDLIIVSACKPKFFDEGTTLREVDLATGRLILGQFTGSQIVGRVLAGGSSRVVSELLGCRGDDVLYCGDSIFGDVLKSKKMRGWNTLLVIPELKEELHSYQQAVPAMVHLRNLEVMLADTFRTLTSATQDRPDVTALKQHMDSTVARIDACHGTVLGGLFRCNCRETHFAMQMCRYADLYAATCVNLINYPLFYEYHSDDAALPHESVHTPGALSGRVSPRMALLHTVSHDPSAHLHAPADLHRRGSRTPSPAPAPAPAPAPTSTPAGK